MQHDIIDNRTRKLADCVRPLLAESEAAKFAVGYFFLSGFKLIPAELERLRELRLLIGNVSDWRTIEHLAETHSAAQIIEQSRVRKFANAREREAALQSAAAAMRERLSRLTQTADDERLMDWGSYCAYELTGRQLPVALWKDARIRAAWIVTADCLVALDTHKTHLDAAREDVLVAIDPGVPDPSEKAFAKFLRDLVREQSVLQGIPAAQPWEDLNGKKKYPAAELKRAEKIRGKLNVPPRTLHPRTRRSLSPGGRRLDYAKQVSPHRAPR